MDPPLTWSPMTSNTFTGPPHIPKRRNRLQRWHQQLSPLLMSSTWSWRWHVLMNWLVSWWHIIYIYIYMLNSHWLCNDYIDVRVKHNIKSELLQLLVLMLMTMVASQNDVGINMCCGFFIKVRLLQKSNWLLLRRKLLLVVWNPHRCPKGWWEKQLPPLNQPIHLWSHQSPRNQRGLRQMCPHQRCQWKHLGCTSAWWSACHIYDDVWMVWSIKSTVMEFQSR